ncbi:MAG: alpha-amylase, partial [Gallionella sp.]|nr:alpha-amylase [Gallionella sp.]
ELSAFADFDNRQLIAVGNPNLLVYLRADLQNPRNRVLVVANFNDQPQFLPLEVLRPSGFYREDALKELCSGMRVETENEAITVPALSCCWLAD